MPKNEDIMSSDEDVPEAKIVIPDLIALEERLIAEWQQELHDLLMRDQTVKVKSDKKLLEFQIRYSNKRINQLKGMVG